MTSHLSGASPDLIRELPGPSTSSCSAKQAVNGRKESGHDAEGLARLGKSLPRRQFITLLGGAAGAWPNALIAQLNDRMRRIGILSVEALPPLHRFRGGLPGLGYIEGQKPP